jgi:diaminohydroxyphosphoribosylaminopyrimidine deaminase/5-amino-6-(5-phosphoribosylamino)uracil reductase
MDLVDEYVVYLAPKLLGGDKLAIGSIDVPSIDAAKEIEFQSISPLGSDVLLVANPVRQG